MWLLKNLLWLLIMILVVGFAILNMKETVSAIHLPGHAYTTLPANVVIFTAFVLGMIAAFLLVLFQMLRIRSGMADLRRENENLKKELNQLRNLPLEDLRLGPTGAGSL
ncbi:MAG: lipopolysaccharide assembly protein LapA domain-containing protein [Hyphomicrobiales bacterium]